MAKLVLVKHAPPEITPGVVAHRWVLSAEGRDRCAWLADELRAQGVSKLYSSLEPKALETAALAAMGMGLEVRPRRDLHENDRTGLAFGPVRGLTQRMRRFFEAPFELIVGEETAHAALERFESAVRAAAAEAPDQTIAIVTHGTVLTLLTAKYNPIAAFEFWEALTLPSYVALNAATFTLDGTISKFPA